MSRASIQIEGGATRDIAEVEPGQAALRVWNVNGGGGGGGGTEFAEDAPHSSGALGTLALAVRNDTPGSLSDTDGDYSVLQVDGSGRLRVTIDNVPAVTVSGTVDVSGSTVTIQEPLSVDDNGGSLTVDDGGGSLTIDGSVSVSNFPAVQPVSDNGGSLTVDGTVAVSSVAGNVTTVTPYQRDQAVGAAPFIWPAGFRRRDTLTTLTPADGDWVLGNTTSRGALWVKHDGTIAVDTVTPGTAATNLGKAEDAAHTSGATGVMGLAVRNDTPSALAGTNGDYIPLTTDNVGALYVRARQATRGNLLCNASLQLQGADVVAGAGLSTARTVRVPVQNYGYNGLPQLTFPLAGAAETFGVSMVDPSAIQAAGVNAALGGLSGTGGGLRTGPDRDTYVSLFSGQVFNATTSANSSSVDVSTARWANIFIELSVSAGTPTDIRLIAQFSPDSGTTWYDYAVDQWVDLRFVGTQMPLNEVIPLNYVIPGLFRLRGVATGTDGSNTFTLSADIQAVS